jgi:hypothetical protein
MRTRVLTIVLLVAVLPAAACGGGSSDRLSKPDYIKRGDAICAKAKADIAALGAPPNTAAEFVQYAAKAQPIFARELADLKKLKAPKDDEQKLREMLAHVQEGVNAVSKAASAATANDAAALTRAAEEIQTADKAASDIAAAYGFHTCGTSR